VTEKEQLDALKLLNSVILPVKYSDQVYRDCMHFPELTTLGTCVSDVCLVDFDVTWIYVSHKVQKWHLYDYLFATYVSLDETTRMVAFVNDADACM